MAATGDARHPSTCAARRLARHHPAVPHLLRDLRRSAERTGREASGATGSDRHRVTSPLGVRMPWFPDFTNAVELARRETRAAGLTDPAMQYLNALNAGDAQILETVWPGDVIVHDPRAGMIRG